MKTTISIFSLAILMASASSNANAATVAPYVQNPKFSADVLVKEAFNKISRNYSNDESVVSVYYKENVSRDNQTISLNEALLDIEKSSYLNKKDDKILVKKIRKSETNIPEPLKFKLQGGPVHIAKLDIVKYSLPGCDNKKMEDLYTFEYDTPVEQGGKIMYVVKFDQKTACDEILYRGKIYIDSESCAISKVEFNMNIEERGDGYLSFIKNKPSHIKVNVTNAKYVVGYKEYNGKWYYDFSRSDLSLQVKNKKSGTNNNFSITSGMVVTSYNPSTTIPHGELIKASEILADKKINGEESLIWELYDEMMLLAML
ncbi:hypothetical protein MASR1M46_06320 [Bacteroidales bacterium]